MKKHNTSRTKQKGANAPGLDEPSLRHGQNFCARNDQVIQHPHVDQSQRCLQRLSQVLVGT